MRRSYILAPQYNSWQRAQSRLARGGASLSSMSITSKNILPVGALLRRPLHIPDYQRPYRWQAFHVNQLFDDLLFHRERQRYRLGTVVLHAEADGVGGQRHDIVDGQQRLLTLVLLCGNPPTERARLEVEFST